MQKHAPAPLPAPLCGIVPPLVTPLAGRDELDVAGLDRLLDHVLAGGVTGVFVLGTTGEASSLGARLKAELIDRTCQRVAGRVPVLVGVTDNAVVRALETARRAAEAGAAAVVVSTPYYIPLEQAELLAYVRAIVAEQPLPVFLYNIPRLTRTAFEPETIARLAELPRVVGIKDSSGDLAVLAAMRERVSRPDWTFLVGPEALLADAVLAGAHGCVGAGSNLEPALLAAVYRAAAERDLTRVADLRRRLAGMDRIYRTSTGQASVIRGLKCALSLRGLCDARMAEPYRPCDETERAKIREFLAELDAS
jgi:2-dehydro-3-deoxy-D-pentonate aldolase